MDEVTQASPAGADPVSDVGPAGDADPASDLGELTGVQEPDGGYDVVVVGGGAAGLSGAVTLARARRSVLVVDAGEPRNAPAEGVHSYLTRDGTPPHELLALGREEARRYGAHVVGGRIEGAARDGDGFVVTVAGGRDRGDGGGDGGGQGARHRVRARRLLVTTGLVDELPDVPGVRELWGRDVVHCPYCHGWEISDQAIGVLGSGPMAVFQALLFRHWSPDVVLFRHTAPPPSDDERAQLAGRGIRVVDGKVEALEIAGDRLRGVRLETGEVVPRRAVAVQPRFVARAGVLATLGLEAQEHPAGIGTHVASDPTGRTDVPGVWVAGNVADPMAQVISAAAAGTTAAAAINVDLLGIHH